ncbi:MAG: RodZ domain-containing protein [Terriglobales bacterium]
MASFGTRLKEERERRKITLDEISASTKISTRLLHALEDDHFELLPGGIFNKGFIRAYAQHIGLDEDQLIAEYLEASGVLPVDGKPDGSAAASAGEIHAEADVNDEATLPWGLFAVILLIVALGFAVWGFYSRQTVSDGKTPSARPPDPASVPSLTTPATSDSRQPAATASLGPARPAVTPVSTDATGATAARVIGGSSAATPAAGAIRLRISVREDSWVSVTADGKHILSETLSASTDKSVQAAKEITVKAGNIGALDFEWNGKKLPPQGSEGEVMTLSFDANGWHTVPKAPASESGNQF